MKKFENIAYLKTGNPKQQLAYADLVSLNIFENLKAFSPILAGTIPIEIDLPNSDLDVICCCKNPDDFAEKLTFWFGKMNGFQLRKETIEGIPSIIAQFKSMHFTIEIFGQNKPSEMQNAYRHMLVEYKILQKMGEQFRQEIIQLKKDGWKTEPAFAKLLGLSGDPYQAILDYRI